MSNSAINTQVAQQKIGNVQNQADTSAVYNAGNWSFKNSTALTSVTITDAGNVGIGTASPRKSLEVKGTAGSNALQSTDSVNGTNFFRMYSDATFGSVINVNTGGAIRFAHSDENYASFTERMRIDSSGNVGIGTASPAVKLETVGQLRSGNTTQTANAISAGVYLSNRGNSAAGVGTDAGIFAISGSPSWFSGTSLAFYTNPGPDVTAATAVERMRITTTGTIFSLPTYNNGSGAAANMAVTASGEFVRSTSALKYKEDITPISHGLQTVLSMQPIEYKSKCEADKDAAHKFIGFVADWEETNLPALVQKNGEGEVEGFSYDRLTAVLCKAIQELSAKVEEQSSRIDAQAEEIKALKAKP